MQNVIPDDAIIKLNVRTFDAGVRKHVLAAIERIVNAEAEAKKGRPGRRAIRMVRPHVRILQARFANRLHPWRILAGTKLDGGQGEAVRVPLADGTLVRTRRG